VSEIEFWVSGEWTMVYLDGHLIKYGDSYLADEWLQEHCGVRVVYDTQGHSVPDGHNPVKELADVKTAQRAYLERVAEANKKRRQAEALIAEAEALVKKP